MKVASVKRKVPLEARKKKKRKEEEERRQRASSALPSSLKSLILLGNDC